MTAVRVSAHKDVRAEARILHRLGYTYARHDSRSHPVFTHPQHREITLPDTPSGPGWRHRHRRDLADAMAMTLLTLEALIAGQGTVGKRAARRERRRARSGSANAAPRALRHLSVAPESIAAPAKPAPSKPRAARDYRGPITRGRRARWERLQLENERRNVEERFNVGTRQPDRHMGAWA